MSVPQGPQGQQPVPGQGQHGPYQGPPPNPYQQQNPYQQPSPYQQQPPGYGPPPGPYGQPLVLPYRLADTGTRVVQGIIDALIAAAPALAVVLVAVVVAVVGATTETPALAVVGAILYFVAILAGWGMNFYCQVWRPAKYDGQTIGMAQKGLRVVKIDGSPVTMGDLAIRWLLYFFVEGGLIALILIAATQRKQRLGDLAAKTLVVHVE
ncbi:MAG: hypothetical protein GEV10_18510 [Streptosporangiales bacterium]|nr:hypothetical protein [Streptosporangiales bacterium]